MLILRGRLHHRFSGLLEFRGSRVNGKRRAWGSVACRPAPGFGIMPGMWNVLRMLVGRPSTDPRARRAAFFQRYRARTLIVHAGLTVDWLEELLKQGGGGGHFRIDARLTPARTPTPVEWVVHEFIVPLALPLPLIARVSDQSIRIRHLVRHGALCHPSDIAWILDDMGDDGTGLGRAHVVLYKHGDGFRAERGIAPEDNAIDTPYGTL